MTMDESGDKIAALAFLNRASELGEPHAQFTCGADMLDKARRSSDKTMEAKAISLLEAAAGEGDLAEAKVFIADEILSGSIRNSKFDPMMLLSEATVQGNEDALQILMGLNMPASEEADYDPMLPYTIKPDGLKRPRLVRDALRDEFDMPQSLAETITAGLYGFPSWARLASLVDDARVPAGKFDEDLSAAEINERLRLLAGVLMHHMEMPSYIADIAVQLLRPTVRSGNKPSLRKLEEEANSRIFTMGTNKPDPIGKHVLDQRGLMMDMENAMRFGFRIKPDVWLDVMEDAFGWSVEDVEHDICGEGVLVAKSTTALGTFDIYMSRVSFRPGDRGDEHVEKLMAKIDGLSKNAVLLFNTPTAHLPESKLPNGMLYGGKIRKDGGTWRDFVLRPSEDGLADAIGQGINFADEGPSPELVERYSFADAGRYAMSIAMEVRNDDEDHFPITLGEHGWSVFLSRPVIQQMTKEARR